MSVMLISDKTYDQVASSIEFYIKRDHVYVGEVKYKYNLREIVRDEVLKLRQANYDSYNRRCREDAKTEPIAFRDNIPMTAVQLYKQLKAIWYQIETDYKSEFMDTFESSLSYYIISNLPQYEAAAWGD